MHNDSQIRCQAPLPVGRVSGIVVYAKILEVNQSRCGVTFNRVLLNRLRHLTKRRMERIKIPRYVASGHSSSSLEILGIILYSKDDYFCFPGVDGETIRFYLV